MSEHVSLIDGHIDGANTCVICGRDIPEGSQYCVICGKTDPRDMVEVVRCKDCKNLMFSDFYGECTKGYMGIVSPNDCCSKGERKESEKV